MKPKKNTRNKSTLSDKIADALTVKPRADIEDDHVFGTKPKIVSRSDLSSESDDEATISDFRRRNVTLLSELSKKYEGQVVSRADLDESLESSDEEKTSVALDNVATKHALKASNGDVSSENEAESEADSLESDDYSITKFQKKVRSEESDEESDEDEEEDEEEGYDISQLEEPVKESFEHMMKQNVSEEVKKGGCVRSQLLLWESLLEMRIHLQRCMNTANQMPIYETYEHMRNANVAEFNEESNSAKANITNVLDKMLSLQNTLLQSYPETKHISSGKKLDPHKVKEAKIESDEEIPSDTEDEEIPSDTDPEEQSETPAKPTKADNVRTQKKRKLEDYEKEIAASHKAFKPFRDATIQKWNEKTRIGSAVHSKNAPTNTILQQVSFILSDRNKLIKRTQLKRSEYDIVGYKKQPVIQNTDENEAEMNPSTKDRKDDDEYIPEIFDDSDFYHQLLRELIECKSADISDPVQLSRQWIALQQMRSKMKRKVDTKATKGRRIKYVVHNRLVNFMAPEKNLNWPDESKDELYSSLFGKMYENNNGYNMNAEGSFKITNDS